MYVLKSFTYYETVENRSVPETNFKKWANIWKCLEEHSNCDKATSIVLYIQRDCVLYAYVYVYVYMIWNKERLPRVEPSAKVLTCAEGSVCWGEGAQDRRCFYIWQSWNWALM